MGTPEGTLGTPDTPRILGALRIPAMPETPDTKVPFPEEFF